ncbi:HAD family hydrolase [Actinocorallia libanotica]|uniref:HAD family hydrolase n=1 Tax=Actinocorallia libanotica TaxID=46162 RepID=UPI0031D96ECA
MVKAVLWDVDDTLFDHTGADRKAFHLHFTAEGLPSDDAALATWRELTEAAYARFTAGELTFPGQRRERARAYLGPETTDDEADAWFTRYIAHFEASWTAFPDAAPALAELPYRHAVLSNSVNTVQERKLTHLGLRHHFELLLCSDDVGHSKPDPRAFHAACKALDLPPEQVAYIGDRLDLDALGAHAAGLHGIWLDRTGDTDAPPGIHRITTLATLPKLLAEL